MMKRIKTITLAVAIMTCAVGNATAEEFEFNAPNINGKLNVMVEAKINMLVKELNDNRGYTRVVGHLQNNVKNLPTVVKEKFGYDLAKN